MLWTGLTQNSSRAGSAAPWELGLARWEQTAQEGLEVVLCCFLCSLRPCKGIAPLQPRVYSRVPIPGSIQDQIIWGLEQPGIEGPCAHGRGRKEMMFKVPFNPKYFLFCDSLWVYEFVPQPVPGTTPHAVPKLHAFDPEFPRPAHRPLLFPPCFFKPFSQV